MLYQMKKGTLTGQADQLYARNIAGGGVEYKMENKSHV